MKLLNKIKNRKDNKGFTLVELIVVIVILAILAAILVPALTKWIDKAKDQQILVDARTAYLAAQTCASEEYAKKTPAYKATGEAAAAAKATMITNIRTLADLGASWNFEATIDQTNGKVTKFVYTDTAKTATFENGSWNITSGTTVGEDALK